MLVAVGRTIPEPRIASRARSALAADVSMVDIGLSMRFVVGIRESVAVFVNRALCTVLGHDSLLCVDRALAS